MVTEENPGFLIKGLPHGFIQFYIGHAAARKMAEGFMNGIASRVKDSPGLFSLCLLNEPSYYVGGHDPDSRPFYTDSLKQRHGTIDTLNELYGTAHEDFASVAPPLPLGYRQPHIEFMPKEGQPGGGSVDEDDFRPGSIGQSRWYFDWCEFNTDYVMDWYEWLNDCVKRAGPSVRTHIKICELFTVQRTLWGARDDVERPTLLTDIAGNDSGSAYGDTAGFPAGYAFQWMQQGMLYDSQWSITGKPVYNSENHLLEVNTMTPVPLEDTRATLWHEALHHQGATVIWVWQEPLAPGVGLALKGSIYVRPANMYGAALAFFDLNRLMDKVAVVANARPRVAILQSSVPLFWEQDRSYGKTTIDAYIALTFTGEPVGFITPRMLAAGGHRDYEIIIVPNATAVRDATVTGLVECMKRGTNVIAIGDGCLTRDEYRRERELPAGLADIAVLDRQEHARMLAPKLRMELTKAGLKLTQPADARTGKPAWGVECRVVPTAPSDTRQPTPDTFLLSTINLMPDPQTVSLDLLGDATDLVTGDKKNLKRLPLAPMQYVLLEVSQ